MRLNEKNHSAPIIEFDKDEMKYIKRACDIITPCANRLQSDELLKVADDYNLLHLNNVVGDLSNIINASLLLAELYSDAQHQLLQLLNSKRV